MSHLKQSLLAPIEQLPYITTTATTRMKCHVTKEDDDTETHCCRRSLQGARLRFLSVYKGGPSKIADLLQQTIPSRSVLRHLMHVRTTRVMIDPHRATVRRAMLIHQDPMAAACAVRMSVLGSIVPWYL